MGIFHSFFRPQKPSDSETVIYTIHLSTPAATVFFLLFLLLAVAVLLRVVLRSRTRRMKLFRTRLLLFLVFFSALMRSIFFILLPFKFTLKLYFFLWYFPELLNITCFILLLRQWARVYASSRHLAVFSFKRTKRCLLPFEMTIIALIHTCQTVLYIILAIMPLKYFDPIQRADAMFLTLIELGCVVLFFVAWIGIQILRRYALQHSDLLPTDETCGQLANRVDMVVLIWVLARVIRVLDTVTSTSPELDHWFASLSFFFIYVSIFYFFAELLPAGVLLMAKVIETLDKGTSDIAPEFPWERKGRPLIDPGNLQYDEEDTEPVIAQLKDDPLIADTLIPYEDLDIVEYLGRGVGGTVKKAVWKDTVVAVKELAEPLQEGRYLLDFVNEIKLMRSLRHPNIVAYYGAVIEPPKICIVEEYLKRDNLRTVLNDRRIELSLLRIGKMARDICRAMGVIHARQIYHRDLKPENLLVDRNFRIKVGDFGVSRIQPLGIGGHTGDYALSVAGSSIYIAPEVFSLHYNHKADVFSFGIILWEMYNRRAPGLFPEDWLNGKRPSIPKSCPLVLSSLIQRCWSMEPDDRPEFHLIFEELKAWKEELKNETEATQTGKTSEQLLGSSVSELTNLT